MRKKLWKIFNHSYHQIYFSYFYKEETKINQKKKAKKHILIHYNSFLLPSVESIWYIALGNASSMLRSVRKRTQSILLLMVRGVIVCIHHQTVIIRALSLHHLIRTAVSRRFWRDCNKWIDCMMRLVLSVPLSLFVLFFLYLMILSKANYSQYLFQFFCLWMTGLRAN